MDIDNFFGLQVALHVEREPRVPRLHIDPREGMSEFKRHFRFRLECGFD